MNEPQTTQKTGKIMMYIAWIFGLLLLTQFFGAWEAEQINPNQAPESQQANGRVEVELKQNRQGHYMVSGTVNKRSAQFMLDTGATDVVIPADLANFYKLPVQGQTLGVTANGIVEMQATTLEEISIGEIKLYNVRASINPGMEKQHPILLGMSALRQLNLNQNGNTLTLIQSN